MNKKDFLLEIGCEELPSHSLEELCIALNQTLENELNAEQLTHQDSQLFATPRRLAILVPELIAQQPPRKIERQGPIVEMAYDKNGSPTLACLGFARSCGVSIDQLKIKKNKKSNRVYCVIDQSGGATMNLLPDIVNNSLKKLSLHKPMRWGNYDISFIRPVHWVLMLYGNELIKTTILGKKTTQETRGHRFHHPHPIFIKSPKAYNMQLYTHGYVIANFKTRKELIRKQIFQKINTTDHAIIDENLLNEVTAMVEWPIALKGKFDPKFLNIPKESLTSSMQTHQKCFPVENKEGFLQPYFVLISNIESKNPDKVIQGNERVINARLSDAAFFYEQDCKHSLESRLKRLEKVLFQKELGNMSDKSHRIAKLAGIIAPSIHADTHVAKRAGLLCKADLVSEMVYEFPSLQGIMGYYYALHDMESSACAIAIKEHYWPRFSGDKLPETKEGCAVALADRFDSLVGILGINKIPTGDKDPYALRRSAYGILRILIEKELSLDLMTLLKQTEEAFDPNVINPNTLTIAYDFIMVRLKSWYLDQLVPPEVFEAVMARNPTIPLDFHHRIQAVCQFQTLPEASALTAANKRVSNILKKAGISAPKKIDISLFEFDAERHLANLLNKKSKTVTELYKNADYKKALSLLSTLKEPIDNFFDQVMVMVDDEKKRNNRLSLLASLRQLFTQVADIALLPPEG